MNTEVKRIFTTSFVAKAASDKEENREIDFIASKEIVDRYNDIVAINGIDLKNYKDNPVILWAHNSTQPPIGKATKITKKGDELRVRITFAPPEVYSFADTIYKLVKNGFLNALSIGFIADYDSIEVNAKTNVRVFKKSELVEISAVPVPANSQALVVGKALEAGVVDEVEMNEFKLYCEEAEKSLDKPEVKVEVKIEEVKVDPIEELTKRIENIEKALEQEARSSGQEEPPDAQADEIDTLIDEIIEEIE
jgi:HK97 family phage prohead protease